MKTDRRKPHGTEDFYVAEPGDELHFGSLRMYFVDDGTILVRAEVRAIGDSMISMSVTPTGNDSIKIKLVK